METLTTPNPNNLPTPLSTFIGREQEIAKVKQLISANRLFTISGPGGCGKTRLALKVAEELLSDFEDGIWFIEFASLSEPALVPQTVASTWGVYEQSGRTFLDVLCDYLLSHHILLVFDNCEHLISACARLAEGILQKCNNVKILATSREALGITGEIIWSVPPLSLPDLQPWTNPESALEAIHTYEKSESVQLFVARAQAISSGFSLTAENGAWVANICRHLDGMPLAIELAAARVRSLSVQEIAQRLDDRFELLTLGSRTAPPRQQTLAATLDWSYALLSAKEQEVLQRLCVFAGGATLQAAEAVCADDEVESAGLLDALSHLVDKSLVIADQPQHGETRYHLLENIREYAHERLLESREQTKTYSRHLDYFVLLAEQAEPKLKGSDQGNWLNRLKVEHSNLRAALARAISNDAKAGLRLVGAVWWFWRVCGYVDEGCDWMSKILALPDAMSRTQMRAKALHGAAFLESIRNDNVKARALYEESLSLYTDLGDKKGIANALIGLGFVARGQHDWKVAPIFFKKGLKLGREIGNKHVIAVSLEGLGLIAEQQRDWTAARTFFEQFLAIERELDNSTQIALALFRLGSIAFAQHDIYVAHARFEESLSIYQELDFEPFIALVLNKLGDVARYQGDYEQASTLYTESLNRFEEQGVGFENYHVKVLINMGYVAHHQGFPGRARDLFEESLLICHKLVDERCSALCLIGIAGILASKQRSQKAVSLVSAARTVLDATDCLLTPPDQAEYEQNLAVARAQLNMATFDAAWDAGRVMSLEQAVNYARSKEEMLVKEVKEKFGGLTARECEAAALIAQGKSNREIAEVMIVSVRTVETYVTRILSKLGFDSRVQIATWAIEKGLWSSTKDS